MAIDDGLIDGKFSEWTKGLDPKAARIALFNKVRDIPYMIIPELRDPAVGTSGIIEKGCGSCVPKHWLLAELFKKLWLKIKYATYPFYWHEGRLIKYPFDLKLLMKDLPVTNHLALKAEISCKWVLVDTTYDLALKKVGFPVNENWDGSRPTLNAVHPLKEILHDTVEERVRYDAEARSLYTGKEKAAMAEFVPKLNAWFQSLR